MAEGKFLVPDHLKISLPRNPRLAPWVRELELGDNRLQLRGADHTFTLQHPLFIDIFRFLQPLLTGRHTQQALLKKSRGKYLPDTVLFVLRLLRANGMLQEGAPQSAKSISKKERTQLEPQIQFLSHFTTDPDQVLLQLQNANLQIIGSPQLTNKIVASLKSAGFKKIKPTRLGSKIKLSQSGKIEKAITTNKNPIDLLIACQESQAIPFFSIINALAQEKKFRWLPISVSGTTGMMGPTIIPSQTACYTCLHSRIAANVPNLESHLNYHLVLASDSAPENEGVMPPLLSLLADQATLESIRLITGLTPPQTIQRLFEFKISSPIPLSHQVFRVPRCQDCHPPAPRPAIWDYKTLSKQ